MEGCRHDALVRRSLEDGRRKTCHMTSSEQWETGDRRVPHRVAGYSSCVSRSKFDTGTDMSLQTGRVQASSRCGRVLSCSVDDEFGGVLRYSHRPSTLVVISGVRAFRVDIRQAPCSVVGVFHVLGGGTVVIRLSGVGRTLSVAGFFKVLHATLLD